MKSVKSTAIGRVFDMRHKNYRDTWEYRQIAHWNVVNESGNILAGGLNDGGFYSDTPRFRTKKLADAWIKQAQARLARLPK